MDTDLINYRKPITPRKITPVFLTREEFEKLSEEEKNNPMFFYVIEEDV